MKNLTNQSDCDKGLLFDYKETLNNITYADFKEILLRFVGVVYKQASLQQWFGLSSGHHPGLRPFDENDYRLIGSDENSSYFFPFVQKSIVENDTKVIVIGDIHGDIDTLLAIIQRLYDSEVVDKDLNVIKPDVKIVFVGDYVNRRAASVPVVALLIDLYCKNPDNVVLLKGNHESAATTRRFDERVRLYAPVTKHNKLQTTFLQELAHRFDNYVYPDLLWWFDYVPTAYFLGRRTEQGMVDYTLFCHGGLELGYNPAGFLADQKSTFACIETLSRKSFLDVFKQQYSSDNHVKKQLGLLQAACELDDYSPILKSYTVDSQINPAAQSSHMLLRLGFIWDNFVTEENDTVHLAFSPTRRNLYVGKELMQAYFAQASAANVQLHSIVRGHQHLDEEISVAGMTSTMFTRIVANNGVVAQWNGAVYTLGASDGITGVQSFVIIDMNGPATAWSVRHYWKKPSEQSFCIKMNSFLQ